MSSYLSRTIRSTQLLVLGNPVSLGTLCLWIRKVLMIGRPLGARGLGRSLDMIDSKSLSLLDAVDLAYSDRVLSRAGMSHSCTRVLSV